MSSFTNAFGLPIGGVNVGVGFPLSGGGLVGSAVTSTSLHNYGEIIGRGSRPYGAVTSTSLHNYGETIGRVSGSYGTVASTSLHNLGEAIGRMN